MNHHLPTSDAPDAHQALFQQGATEIITHGDSYVALWTQHTPPLENVPIATIGGCQFSGVKEGVELLQYTADHLLKTFPIVVGPMNGNTWLEHRLVTYSDGSPPFMLEPNTPPEWKEVFQEAGFSVLSSYSSSRIQLDGEKSKKLARLKQRLEKSGVRIRPLNPDQFSQDLSAIYDLSCEGFKRNFLYTELPRETFIAKYEQAQGLLDAELILLAEKEGEAVGFVFCYPDPSNQGVLIVKTLARHPGRPVAGIGNVLVEEVQQRAYEKGYTSAIHALQFEDNSSLKITSRYEPEVIRHYALMQKRA